MKIESCLTSESSDQKQWLFARRQNRKNKKLSEVVAMNSNIKQVIVVRRDLNMRKGKLAAQVAHASMKFLIDNDESNRGDEIMALRFFYKDCCWD
jgi:hypothetical protein